MFDGQSMHGGDPILLGTRYIIAGFMLLNYRYTGSDKLPGVFELGNTAAIRPVEPKADSTSFNFNFMVE